MNMEKKEAKPKRSKVMRIILIAIALAYFWSSRHIVFYDHEKIIRYNKWTAKADSKNLNPVPNKY